MSRRATPRGNAPTRAAVGSRGRQEVSVLICSSKVRAGIAGLATTTVDAAGVLEGAFDAKMAFLTHFSCISLLKLYAVAYKVCNWCHIMP